MRWRPGSRLLHGLARGVALCALAAVSLPPSLARAQPSAVERHKAIQVAGQALDLFKAGDYAAALARFEEADAVVPAPTLKLKAAQCLDKLDRMLEAADRYRQVIAFELDRWAKPQQKQAREQAVPELAALLEATPSIVIELKGNDLSGAEITLGGEPVELAALGDKRALDPGSYAIVARRGGQEVRHQVRLRRGQNRRVVLTVPDAVVVEPTPPGASPWRIAGFALLGLGGAGLSLWSIAGVAAAGQESALLDRCIDRRCPPDAHADAGSFATTRDVSTAGFYVGLAGGVAGGSLLLLDALGVVGEEPAEAAGVRVRPLVGPMWLGASGSF